MCVKRYQIYNPNPKFADFLKQYPAYDYNGTLYEMKATQFPHISKNETYLDYTGANTFQHK